jgi:hypothetical protein
VSFYPCPYGSACTNTHDSSGETEELILQTVLSLVSQPAGAAAFNGIEDLSPLTELAPSRPMVLDILTFAWLQQQSNATLPQDKQRLTKKIDKTIMALVSSFKGADPVTLLEFLGNLLRKLDPEVIPRNPQWLIPVVAFIRNLVTSRPTQNGRAAYTNLCAALLQAYPIQAPRLLFSNAPTTSTTTSSSDPFSFLLVSLLLVDLRASFPTLLEQINSPTYPQLSTRLTSAYDTISHFISYLVRSFDSPNELSPSLTPSNLLTLRKSLSETMADTIQYLRDRYDASVAGAMGLHPSARAGPAHTDAERMTVTWDSKTDTIETDSLVLAAIRALALWLREDDGDMLRREAAGIMDLLMDLYRSSMAASVKENILDFRQPILIALEGITDSEEGREALLEHDGWKVLTEDLLSILDSTSTSSNETEASRGIEIIRILLPVVEAQSPSAREEWSDILTRVSQWHVPDARQPAGVVEFQVAVLQFVTGLIEHSHPSVGRRFKHSIGDIVRLAEDFKEKVGAVQDEGLAESLDEVLETLEGMNLGSGA